MEEIKNEQAELKAQAVNTEEDKGATKSEASVGKFKDVETLLNAYNSLQSEFTKRCQRVKELEELIATDKAKAPDTPKITEGVTERGITREEQQNVLADYLKSVMNLKGKAVVLDGEGVGVATPLSKPKTLEQAGIMAKELLNK